MSVKIFDTHALQTDVLCNTKNQANNGIRTQTQKSQPPPAFHPDAPLMHPGAVHFGRPETTNARALPRTRVVVIVFVAVAVGPRQKSTAATRPSPSLRRSDIPCCRRHRCRARSFIGGGGSSRVSNNSSSSGGNSHGKHGGGGGGSGSGGHQHHNSKKKTTLSAHAVEYLKNSSST